MGQNHRKTNDPEVGASTTPKTHQKAGSIIEITDEETEDILDKEFRKNDYDTLLFRDKEKQWEELKEFKNHVITEKNYSKMKFSPLNTQSRA